MVGSCLLTSLRTAVLPCFPPSHHAVMVEYWADLIKLSFPIAPGRVNFQNWVPDVSFKLSETEKAPAFANAVHAATNASLRTICFDPLGLFSQFLSANSFSYAESPGDDNEWETDWDYTKTLTQKIAIGVSPSSYSDILNMLASLKISFTSHLDVITRLNAPIFAINLSEEWVTLRGVILDALNKKIQLPSTQSRRDLGKKIC